MKYIKQFGIILFISFIGELLNNIIPLPIPASIYGMLILFTALCSGVLKLSQVKETGKFLITAMPLMFIAPAVGLIDSWGTMQEFIVAIIVITVLSTVAVIAAAGHITQLIIKLKGKEGKK
jgi:holin-like protein